MKPECQNIYKNARMTAGMTQERWAEALGISAESVRLYESGRGLPGDEIVAAMCEVAVMPVLGYRHLRNKSQVAEDILPEVPRIELPQAVLQLLKEMKEFREDLDELLVIAADGVVDNEESPVFDDILEALDGVIRAALTVKYAERGGG